MELILHLGAHRTGTTALQKALTRRRQALSACGIAVWGPGAVREMTAGAVLGRAVTGAGDTAADHARLQAARRVLHRLYMEGERGIDRVILSDENLIGTMPDNIREAVLYPHAGAHALALASVLPRAPSVIYLSVRGYADYWASAYVYSALRRRLPDFADVGPDVVAGKRGWVQVVADIRGAFPGVPIRVWIYSGTKTALGRLAADMLGPGRSGLPRILPDRRNERPGKAAFARAMDLRGTKTGVSPTAALESAQAEVPDDAHPYMPFRRHARRLLRTRYATDLAALAGGCVGDVAVLGTLPKVPA